jgi:hypothetical protein
LHLDDAGDEMSHTIGKASLEIIAREIAYEGKPIGSEVPSVGKITTYKVTTSDLSAIIFGVVTWSDGTSEAIPIQYLEGESKYERLERAGRWSLANHGSSWIGELNAMKFNPEKGRSNLASASYEELTAFAESDFKGVLNSFGDFVIDTKENLYGETNKNKSRLALKCEAGNKDIIAAAFVVTRVLATLKDHGM